jgi:hypothetical protein
MGLADSRVEGVRFARMWFEQIAETVGVPAAEVQRHVARLIVRIIVHHQDFPGDRTGQRGGCKAVQRFRQVTTAIIGAQNDRDIHDSSVSIYLQSPLGYVLLPVYAESVQDPLAHPIRQTRAFEFDSCVS